MNVKDFEKFRQKFLDKQKYPDTQKRIKDNKAKELIAIKLLGELLETPLEKSTDKDDYEHVDVRYNGIPFQIKTVTKFAEDKFPNTVNLRNISSRISELQKFMNNEYLPEYIFQVGFDDMTPIWYRIIDANILFSELMKNNISILASLNAENKPYYQIGLNDECILVKGSFD